MLIVIVVVVIIIIAVFVVVFVVVVVVVVVVAFCVCVWECIIIAIPQRQTLQDLPCKHWTRPLKLITPQRSSESNPFCPPGSYLSIHVVNYSLFFIFYSLLVAAVGNERV